MMVLKRLKLILSVLISVLAFTAIGVSIASSATPTSPVLGDGNINVLPQFTSTTSPTTSITQRTFGKSVYLTGLSDGCVYLLSGIITTNPANITCNSGGGGGSGGGSFSTSTAWGSVYYNYPLNQTDVVLFGYDGAGVATSTNEAEFSFDPTAKLALFLQGTKVGIGTTSPYATLSVVGQAVAEYFTATSTTASVFPLANITKLSNLTSNGFVKTSGGDGTLSVDTTTYLSAVTATSPLSGSGTGGSPLVIQNAAADGSTKGAASFTASDFDASSGNISIDYTNGQAASGANKGFLTSADWTTFNNKQATISTTFPITLSGATVGFGGLSTSSAPTVGQLPYWTGVNTFGSVATTSVSCSGSTTCTSFTVLGSSPITISSSGGGGGSGNVATSTAETSGYVSYWTSTGATPATLGSDSGLQYSDTADRVTVTNASTTALTISSNGYVLNTLDFGQDGALSNIIRCGDVGNIIGCYRGSATIPIWGYNHTNGNTMVQTSFSGGDLQLGTFNSGVNVTIEGASGATSGFVGIGTSSPYRTFSVGGEAVFGSDVIAAYFTATSTSATSTLPQLTGSFISGYGLSSCNGSNKVTWASGLFGCEADQTGGGGAGSGTVSTSTPLVNTYVTYATGPSTIGAESAFTYNATTDLLTILFASTTAFSNSGMASTSNLTVSNLASIPNASTTVLTVSGSQYNTNLTSAIVQTGADGLMAEYAGTSCTNQFVRSLSALGVATCATVGSGDVSLANLTATDSTLTFSGTYNGSTARTIGLNLGNANTWTALQTFNNSSTTLASFSYASSTIWRGGGLDTDCDGDTQALGWDTTTGQFTCGDDDNSGGGGGQVGGFTQLATSTSMSIDICDSAYATSSINALGVGTSNIAVTMSGSTCLGKYIYVDVWAPASGLIGTTTFSGVYWNGQINPGSAVINGLTDRFMFIITASSTTFISAKLDSTY